MTAFSGVLLAASVASAQPAAGGELGNRGEFIFGADRLFTLLGFTHASADEYNAPNNTKITDSADSSSLGFFWGGTPALPLLPINFNGLGAGNLAGTLFTVPNFFTVPRLGFDYTIVDHVTIGGELAVFFTLGNSASSTTVTPNSTSTTTVNTPGSSVIGFAPRAGYILRLSDLFALWLRGGLSYYTARSSVHDNNANVTSTAGVNQFALDLDPQFVITPVPHFGFTAGLTADIPLVGNRFFTQETPGTTQTVSAGSSLLFVGVTVGIIGWFGG